MITTSAGTSTFTVTVTVAHGTGVMTWEAPVSEWVDVHKHKWQPVGITEVETVLYSPVSRNDHQVVTQKMAVRSCECGALRRTEVGRKTRWLNR
jgi:hypothetical protein